MAKPASLTEIMSYFSCPGRPITPAEFRAFWSELSEEQKKFYKDGIGEILGDR